MLFRTRQTHLLQSTIICFLLCWFVFHRVSSDQNVPKKTLCCCCCCCLVAKSCRTLCDPVNCSRPCTLVLHYLPKIAQTHVHWVGDAIQPSQTISSSVFPFSFCPQSFPASKSFLKSWLFVSGAQSFGASASASVLPMIIQGWFPLGLTGLIHLLSQGLSRVFSNTTIRKHQFFGTQPYLWSNSRIHTWLMEKP